jgi:hypothetical protein
MTLLYNHLRPFTTIPLSLHCNLVLTGFYIGINRAGRRRFSKGIAFTVLLEFQLCPR